MHADPQPLDSATPLAGVAALPRRRRLSLLMTLYVSQAIPLGFFIEAVPAIGSSLGLGLREVGMIQALALPYMIKFLWAPLVDSVGSGRRDHYRRWLIPLQAGAVLLLLIIAALDPGTQTGLLLALGAAFMLLAATQDIATDGLAVRILASDERGAGNGVQVGGYYLGQILGGGLMLILFGSFGWRWTLVAMAALLTLPLVQLLPIGGGATSESRREQAPQRARIDFRSIGRFFKSSRAGAWLLILLLYRAGDAMAITMMKPMLVGFGYSLGQIGLIVGLGNSVSALLGALSGGMLVERLGRKKALALFASFHALALAGFALPALGVGGLAMIWLTSALTAFAGGMATSALYTAMMDRARRESAGTDFTLQQSLAAVGPLLAASLSGWSAAALGYTTHYLLAAGLSLAVVGLVVLRFDDQAAGEAG